MNGLGRQLSRRTRQTFRILRSAGPAGVLNTVRSRLANALAQAEIGLPVRESDVLAADVAHPPVRAVLPLGAERRMTINWVMTPPSAGSGGHTTIFRILNGLQARGHANRVYFYDPYLGDHRYFEEIVRDYYRFRGPVANVDDGMADAHVTFATGWPTAYPTFNATSAGARCYFVQDLEPAFHPTSSASVLAENTYRMGFHGITAGAWLAQRLRADYGMPADSFDFGCDLESYRFVSSGERRGVCFYVRPSAPRRASEIGLMAVELFARRHPEAEIHLYGDPVGRRAFACIDHGRITPAQLAAIYNRCRAGLSLSLTNVALVPHEMLACGCIPVVNDGPQNRIVLANDFVHYATLTPHALAEAMCAVFETPEFEPLASAAAASVGSSSWDDAVGAVETALLRLLSC